MPEAGLRRDATDAYAVLGVDRHASAEDLARAYRRLAKRYHPDLHAGPQAVASMRRLNRAWHAVSSPARRARYDARTASPVSSAGHWSASRQGVRPAAATSRTWATWQAPADGWHSAGTRRGDSVVRWQRPQERHHSQERRFAESGWAALLVTATVVLLYVVGAYLGSIPR